MQKRLLLAAAAMAGLFGIANPLAAEPFKLDKGNHVCIIGNTLAERMQHTGYLETLIHARFPDHELVFRNLGYSGDEVDPKKRLRSKNFGTPDQWLSAEAPPPNKGNVVKPNRFENVGTKPDVVFAFFGYNESYAGDKGLEAFKKDLDKMLKDMLAKKYNGTSNPRIVLFSPVAHEDLGDPNFTNAAASNKNLKVYAAAMGDVAKENNVTFVDLFNPTLDAYEKHAEPLTINGVHLNDLGDKVVAGIIEKALFESNMPVDEAKFNALRKQVNAKNWYWFHRYRTTDGFSNHGDRGGLTFPKSADPTQTNYEVLQRESEVLDVMVANRDKKVWATAQGSDFKIDDSNTPEFIKVPTNIPGKGPNGQHVYPSGEETLGALKVHSKLKINLFADEKQFPDLINPVQMAWDTKGRLWVATWPLYPHWAPKEQMQDKLLIFSDTDGDGKADKVQTFANDLHNITGFEFYDNGVIVAQGPDIVFLKDTDGDDRYDSKTRIIHGMDTADTHHTANSFTFGPGGDLYFQEGTFHHSQVESPWGPPTRNANGGVFRFEPRTYKFEAYASYGFANPHGHAFDRWGTDIVIDGTGAQPYYGPSFSTKTYYPDKQPGNAPLVYKQRSRPCPGVEILSSRHFPDDWQGNFIVGDVINFQGILNYKLEEKGAGLVGVEQEPICSLRNATFRPSDFEVGPDGALYFTDWSNVIIGHMQHNLRDPSRDREHGRVYRVTYEGRPLLKPAKIAGASIPELLNLLKEPENRTRYQAKIELSGRKSADVVAALKTWVDGLDKADKEYEHQMTEALWVYQWHNVVNEDLLKRNLRSPDYHARAAATRVLCYWRDRVKEPLALLKAQANDEHARVRLEAIRTASYFSDGPGAIEVILETVDQPEDAFIKYARDRAMKTLERLPK
jgi:glucose/arabinose dehydrogenase